MVAFKLLVVHGYRAYRNGGLPILTPQNRAVCAKVATFARRFDYIALLGGWHDRSLSPSETTAIVMRNELIRGGVPASRIIIPQQDPALAFYIPSRETAEEGKLLALFLSASRRAQTEYEVTVIAAKEWVPRIKRIYAALCIATVDMISVDAPTPFHFRMIELGLRAISRIDPLGTGAITGVLQRRIRRSRTLVNNPGWESLIG